MAQGVIEDLVARLGQAAVLVGDAVDGRFRSDRSLTGRHLPMAVVRPAAVAEVAAALAICHRHDQAVVPQGGLTGLAGGANCRPHDVALNLERLTGVEAVDGAAQTMTVLAGTPLAVAQEAAEQAGLLLALDLGSRGSCQIGGNLATNAGGNRVIRYGMARHQVLGLEAVLADGTVVSSLTNMIKNNSGYDLKQLFVGSEGTLGVITRAVLKLHALPGRQETALCGLDRYEQVVELLRRARTELGGLSAFEAMWRDYFAFSAGALGLDPLGRIYPFAVLIERSSTGGRNDDDRFTDFLAGALDEGLIGDALVAQSGKEARSFWSIREGLAVETLPGLINYDVSLAIGRIGEFATACRRAVEARWPGAHCSFYGHVGDGNLHICVADYGESHHQEVDDVVYGTLRHYAGSVSAEHGIGLLKRRYLSYTRSPSEIELMRRVKAALDPKGILNPGKVI